MCSAASSPEREVTYAQLGPAVDLAEGFADFWHSTDNFDIAAMNEWARQVHDELHEVLYGDR